MRPSRRTTSGNTIARRWRPWLWVGDEPTPGRDPAPAAPTPARDELEAGDAWEPVRPGDAPPPPEAR